jgi:hypothetical protein
VHDPADADDPSPADGEGEGTPWERERHARSWWVDAEERDTRADAADGQAEDRDADARARDDAADALMRDARAREELAYRRIREVTWRLNALDAGEARQHLHLQRAAEAIQEAIDSRADEPLLDLLRAVLKLLDVQFADVIAAGIHVPKRPNGKRTRCTASPRRRGKGSVNFCGALAGTTFTTVPPLMIVTPGRRATRRGRSRWASRPRVPETVPRRPREPRCDAGFVTTCCSTTRRMR